MICVINSGRRIASHGIQVYTTANVKGRWNLSARFTRCACQRNCFLRKVTLMGVRASLRHRSIFVTRFTRSGFSTISLCNESKRVKSFFMPCLVLFDSFANGATRSNARSSYYLELNIRLSLRGNYYFLGTLWRDRWYFNWVCVISFMEFLFLSTTHEYATLIFHPIQSKISALPRLSP